MREAVRLAGMVQGGVKGFRLACILGIGLVGEPDEPLRAAFMRQKRWANHLSGRDKMGEFRPHIIQNGQEFFIGIVAAHAAVSIVDGSARRSRIIIAGTYVAIGGLNALCSHRFSGRIFAQVSRHDVGIQGVNSEARGFDAAEFGGGKFGAERAARLVKTVVHFKPGVFEVEHCFAVEPDSGVEDGFLGLGGDGENCQCKKSNDEKWFFHGEIDF